MSPMGFGMRVDYGSSHEYRVSSPSVGQGNQFQESLKGQHLAGPAAQSTASTPGLAYDGGSSLDASREAVYETFVSGLSASQQEQLGDWLPDLLSGKTSAEKTAAKDIKKDEAALKALAKDHEIDIKASGFLGGEVVDRLRLDQLKTAFRRDLAFETTGQLPSVVDMMLADKFGRENGDAALHLELKDDRILKEARAIERAFGDLDAWLPAVLAGQGEMPVADQAAMKLLATFADELCFNPQKKR